MIELKNLSIGYSGDKIVEGINFKFDKDKISFIVGLNGSGKTTLLKSILKIIPLMAGDIYVEGKNAKDISQKEMAKLIAVVLPINFNLPEIKVFEFLNLYKDVDSRKLNQILLNFQLENLKNKYITKVSQGQLQQLFIVRALLQDTPYIILDEPTAHLDYINKPKVFEILKKIQRQTHKGIIIITHDKEYIEQKTGNLLDLSAF